MKNMRGFCILVIIALISMIYPLYTFASDTEKLPVEAFSTLPMNSNLKISPDGGSILYFQNVNDKTALVTFNLKTGVPKTVFIADNVTLMFLSALWVNNDTVLFSVKAPTELYGDTIYQSTLIVRKADASDKPRELITAGNLRANRSKQYSGGIIGLLPDDPDHILIGIDSVKRYEDTVFKVNINNGETSVVQPNTYKASRCQ